MDIDSDNDNEDSLFPPSSSSSPSVGQEEVDDEVEQAYVIFPPTARGDSGVGDSGMSDSDMVDSSGVGDSGVGDRDIKNRDMAGTDMDSIIHSDGGSINDGDGLVIETTATTATTTSSSSSSSSRVHIIHSVGDATGGDVSVEGDVGVRGGEGVGVDVSVGADVRVGGDARAGVGVDSRAGGVSTRVVTEVDMEESREVESVIVVTSSSTRTIAHDTPSHTSHASDLHDTPSHSANAYDTPSHTSVSHNTPSPSPSPSGHSSMTLEASGGGADATGGGAGGGGGGAGGGLSFSGVLAAGTRLEEELTRLKVEHPSADTLAWSNTDYITYTLSILPPYPHTSSHCYHTHIHSLSTLPPYPLNASPYPPLIPPSHCYPTLTSPLSPYPHTHSHPLNATIRWDWATWRTERLSLLTATLSYPPLIPPSHCYPTLSYPPLTATLPYPTPSGGTGRLGGRKGLPAAAATDEQRRGQPRGTRAS